MSGISVHIAFQAWKGIRIVPPLPPRWNAAQSLFLAINTVVLLSLVSVNFCGKGLVLGRIRLVSCGPGSLLTLGIFCGLHLNC